MGESDRNFREDEGGGPLQYCDECGEYYSVDDIGNAEVPPCGCDDWYDDDDEEEEVVEDCLDCGYCEDCIERSIVATEDYLFTDTTEDEDVGFGAAAGGGDSGVRAVGERVGAGDPGVSADVVADAQPGVRRPDADGGAGGWGAGAAGADGVPDQRGGGDMMGQNLGGHGRSREDELRAEVKRLRDQVEALLQSVKRCVNAMRIQEKWESEEFHLSAESFWPMWNGAVEFGEHCIRETEGNAT